MDKEIKQQDSIKMSSDVISTQQSVQKKMLNYYQSAVCSQGKDCLLICCAKQCKNHAIVCADSYCKCYQPHNDSKICALVNPRFIVSKIAKRLISSPQLLNYIDMTLQKLIDQISQFRDKLEGKVKSLGLTGIIGQFLQISKKGQFKQLTGQTVNKVLEQLNKQSKESKQNYAKNLQKKLEEEWSKIEEPIKQHIYSLEKVINQFINYDSSKLPFQDSKVLSSQEQRKRMAQFFPQNRREFDAKLLYRASDNQFSIKQFHDKCDEKAHTAVLIKTQFGKVIGGYTPLTWKGNSVAYNTQQKDQSKESFMFSVTNNDKFTITPESKTHITHQKDYGPIFWNGTHQADLVICNNANNSNVSFASINNAFSNPKYKHKDKASWELFSGQTNGTYNFNITEWQVYQLTF